MKLGRKLNHAFRRIGRKSAPHVRALGRKLSQVARMEADNLKQADRSLQKVKGATVLLGPYKGVADAGIAGVHVANLGVSATRRAANR